MGEPKLVIRFRKFCENNKVDCAFEGVVESWDMIGNGDTELRTRGFFVNSEYGKRYVGLDLRKKNPIAKLPIAIGDSVIITGREIKYPKGFVFYNEDKANSMDIAVLLVSHEHRIWFSFDNRPIRQYDSSLYILWIFLGIAIFGILAAGEILMSGQWFGLLSQWWFIPLFIASLFIACIGEMLFALWSRRPRQYQCDEETWQTLLEEVESMFGITLTTET